MLLITRAFQSNHNSVPDQLIVAAIRTGPASAAARRGRPPEVAGTRRDQPPEVAAKSGAADQDQRSGPDHQPVAEVRTATGRLDLLGAATRLVLENATVSESVMLQRQ